MQRILYLTDSLMAGGTEQQLVELTTRLDRLSFEPHVLCLYSQRARRSLHFLDPLQACSIPVEVLDLGWGAADKLRGVVAIIRAAWRLRPQIIQAVNYHCNLLMRLARPFLPPSIKLIGGVYVDYTANQLRYERLSGWLCAAIVCNSPHLERQLARHVPRSRVRHIPNCVDLDRFAVSADPLLRSRLAPDARRVLLFAGRISEQKSPHLLVEAVGLLKQRGDLPAQTVVWIVGDATEAAAQAALDEAVRRFDLGQVVFQYPPSAVLENYFHAADLTTLPSLWEGLPNVMLESLAAGRPVLASEAANAAGVIADGVNGWIVPTGDSLRLAEVLRGILALSDDHLRAMRPACERTAAPFSANEMVRRYEALYRSLSARS